MNKFSKKICIVIICLCAISYSYGQNPDFKHLDVKLLKVVQAYSRSTGGPGTIRHKDAYTMIKVEFKNLGKTSIPLNLKNVYALDRLNNKYSVHFFSPISKKKKTIKSYKSLKQTLYFDLPSNHQPVMLLIEDRQFSLYN